ncbi:hypothetical protein Tsubulata_033716 [Turnera subulata]|uniref:DUF668 domain-containing protein n=1 Tax=Turnera subulata TaxID=218843 RepID=A0A9Q0JJF7_9ROSI|nr:hypothetical protein Tsubulata_033716 [Turnera subulata]
MALETWLIKVKTAITHSLDSVKTSNPIPRPSRRKSNVGVLSFEVAGLLSKLFHLWHSLSDQSIIRLRNESISLEGVRKIVSDDESFLLGLACAEMAENLRILAKSVSRFSKLCEDPQLRRFDRLFNDFANSGHDVQGWVLSGKAMEAKTKKMDKYVTVTATLHKQMEELTATEIAVKKSVQYHLENEVTPSMEKRLAELRQKAVLQKQEVKFIKERSLWNKSFDFVVSMLVRFMFTVLARHKLVFGIGNGYPTSLPRSLSASATVHPTDQNPTCNFVSGPLKSSCSMKDSGNIEFFESNSRLLKPPPTTLGAAALGIHYANLIIVIEKMIKSPQLIGIDARDDLYGMLPRSIRVSLKDRLKGVELSASDPILAGVWRQAMSKILGWLSPLAHNMIKWQNERSFEQQNLVSKNNVLLLQTLYFANKQKAEAAIAELLVGLNYIWRFEREMTVKAVLAQTDRDYAIYQNSLLKNSEDNSCKEKSSSLS